MTLSYLIGRRNVHNSPWTPTRDALLVQLWAEGYSASAIADQMSNVTRCAVIGRAHRLKLPARAPRQAPGERKPYTRRSNGVPKPPAPSPRPKPPPPPPGLPKMRPLKLLQLKPTSCRFPINDDSPWLFCGAEADGSYCPYHQRITRVRE